MKIAVVTTYFPTREVPYGGSSAYQTLRVLAQRFPVRVFCPIARYPRGLRPRNFLYRPTNPAFSPSGVEAMYRTYAALPFISRVVNGARAAACIEQDIRNFSPDLVLSFGVYPEGFAATRVARRLGVPSVLCAIGSDVNRIPDYLSGWQTRRAVRDADFVFGVSEQLRKQAVELGAVPARSATVVNGCDTAVFRLSDQRAARATLSIPTETKVLLYVGRIEPQKGLHELIDAFAAFAEAQPHSMLVVVGEGTAVPDLQQHAARTVKAGNVRFTGPVPPLHVAQWMAAADVFVLPSYAEGCPNVILEALSCGRPVVASAVGGIPDMVNAECGILVPPRDAVALAKALTEAVRRSWDTETIARHFSRDWSQVADEVQQICESVLRQHVLAITNVRVQEASGAAR
jgi:teichuronic acid biosynthesis glycosyltransferase TuaC